MGARVGQKNGVIERGRTCMSERMGEERGTVTMG